MTLDGILLRAQELPVRPDWAAIFERDAPLLLEIGVGNGEFLVWLAKQRPDANCVGVEMARKFLLKARNRVKQSGLNNVRLLGMEGGQALSRLFKEESLSALYLNFPDPWHKGKHKKRRLVDEGFAWLLASRLHLGGQFLMVTDHEPYAFQVVKAFQDCPAYEPLWDEPVRPGLPGYYMTKYARKWSREGRSFFYIGFWKARPVMLPEWVVRIYPLVQLRGDDPMPHLILRAPDGMDWEKLWRSFPDGILWRDGDDIVNVKGVYLGRDGKTVTVDVVVTEGRLMQRFLVAIHSHREGLMVAVHEVSRPDPTLGVHRAIALLGRCIQEIYPKAGLVRASLLHSLMKGGGK